jgi:hypothetical protein
MIADKEDVSSDGQRLCFGGMPLEDARTLEILQHQEDATFCLNKQEVVSNATSPMESLPILL